MGDCLLSVCNGVEGWVYVILFIYSLFFFFYFSTRLHFSLFSLLIFVFFYLSNTQIYCALFFFITNIFIFSGLLIFVHFFVFISQTAQHYLIKFTLIGLCYPLIFYIGILRGYTLQTVQIWVLRYLYSVCLCKSTINVVPDVVQSLVIN